MFDSSVCFGFYIYQGSEYASGYVRVLNIPCPKYKKVRFPENYKNLSLKKYDSGIC